MGGADGGRKKKLLILSGLYFGHISDRNVEHWARPCEFCLGERCEKCNGAGIIRETQKPGEAVTDAGRELFRAFSWLKSHGLLPAPGSWMDQTARFIAATEWIQMIDGVWHKMLDGQRQAEASLSAQAARMKKR